MKTLEKKDSYHQERERQRKEFIKKEKKEENSEVSGVAEQRVKKKLNNDFERARQDAEYRVREKDFEYKDQSDIDEYEKEERRQKKEYLIRDKEKETQEKIKEVRERIAEASEGEDMDFSRRRIEGVRYASLWAEKKDPKYKILLRAEKRFEKMLKEKRLVKPLEPNKWQKDWIERLPGFFGKYLERYNCNQPESIRDKLYVAPKLDQFGIGGADSLMGNKMYFSEDSLSETKFPAVLAHEYAHFLGVRVLRKDKGEQLSVHKLGTLRSIRKRWGDLFDQVAVKRMGYTMINEGVTDLFSMRVLQENGYEVPTEAMSKGYAPHRRVVESIAKKIGNGDHTKGLDYFIESSLAGRDEELIARINEVYKGKGGYAQLIELLDKFHGFSGPLNALEQLNKKWTNAFFRKFGIKPYPTKRDRHYKKLLKWIEE